MSAPERTEAEMAERIAAFEAAPAAPESWTGSQVAVDLRMAADVLERDGWIQGDYVDTDGCHCLVGAVIAVVGGKRGETSIPDGNRERADRMRRTLISQLIGVGTTPKGFWSDLIDWNDETYRTADQVIAALRAAADKADQA